MWSASVCLLPRLNPRSAGCLRTYVAGNLMSGGVLVSATLRSLQMSIQSEKPVQTACPHPVDINRMHALMRMRPYVQPEECGQDVSH